MCVCVCVCECLCARARARANDNVCVSVCVCARVCLCVQAYLFIRNIEGKVQRNILNGLLITSVALCQLNIKKAIWVDSEG